MDLNEAVDDCKKKIASHKSGKRFKTHFTKEVTKNQKRSRDLREIRIANQFKDQVEKNRDNTETVTKSQTEEEHKIEELTSRLAHLESPEAPTVQSYGAQVPPVITPPRKSDKMIKITSILQVVM